MPVFPFRTLLFLFATITINRSQLPDDWKSFLSPEIFDSFIGRPPPSSFNKSCETCLEGDMNGFDPSAPLASQGGQNFLSSAEARWPKGIVPFTISREFRTSEKRQIRQALEYMSNVTGNCVQFVEHKNEEDYVTFAKAYWCDSMVGRQGSQQTINLGFGTCVDSDLGGIQHEVMHALGFFHEMSRMDRDEFVAINRDNINPREMHNFNAQNGLTFGIPYDYASIMHYPVNAFAENTSIPTIVPKKRPVQCIGQRRIMSPLDVIRIKFAYGCMTQAEIRDMNWEKFMADHPVCAQPVTESGEPIRIGSTYHSPLKTYRLTFQTDNNLVLYRQCDGAVIFATDTYNAAGVDITLEETGELVARDKYSEELLWSSITWSSKAADKGSKYPKASVLLSDSGYFYMCNEARGCYWRSIGFRNKNCNESSDTFPPSSVNYQVVASAGDNVPSNRNINSPNGNYFARFRLPRRFLVRRKCDGGNGFTATGSADAARLTLQHDGNLVMYDQRDNDVWSSGTYGPQYLDPELRLYDDGFLYLCNSDGCYWQSSGFLGDCAA